MHHDNPQNWEAWMRSTRAHQAILTSLKTHQINDMAQRSPSPMKVCTPTPPPMASPIPMKIDKMYTIPAQRSTSPKEEERQKGLCHLCKGYGHIQRYCPRKTPEPPAHAASMKIGPPTSDQGVKRPCSLTMNSKEVLHYLKKTTPKNRNKVVVCYDTACGLQLCLFSFTHVLPFSPRIACRPHA